MVYFCADDYGISACANRRIENCLENGALNKVSVLPNGETAELGKLVKSGNAVLSLHINLIEGRPLSDPKDVSLLVSEDGFFKYSFMGLFLLSFSKKRKELEKQICTEIKNQVRFWKETVGADCPVSIDGHQHTHMIPLVFKGLMRAIRSEELCVSAVRIPDEPILPFLLTPSLYFQYSPTGLIKQWLLKMLALANRKEIKKEKLKSVYFMGVMFSGKMDEKKIKKLLPKYLKLAERHNKDVEMGFHPGYMKDGEKLLDGSRRDFEKFYYSPWRNTEYDTLLNFKL